jgi:hypothetical protein
MFEIEKRPLTEVIAEITVPVGMCVAFTDAPERASPEAERMVPPIELVVTCAWIRLVTSTETVSVRKYLKNRISSYLCCKIKN